jgi:hypothetical protein
MAITTSKTLKPTPEDIRLIKALEKKLGLKYSQVVRMALRRLAEAEGLRA